MVRQVSSERLVCTSKVVPNFSCSITGSEWHMQKPVLYYPGVSTSPSIMNGMTMMKYSAE